VAQIEDTGKKGRKTRVRLLAKEKKRGWALFFQSANWVRHAASAYPRGGESGRVVERKKKKKGRLFTVGWGETLHNRTPKFPKLLGRLFSTGP